jgi:CDP-diacylglycerol--glycerol-3-phosphate 3-phosphatidyltransferase
MLVIPLLLLSFYMKPPYAHWIASTLFLYASLTDFLDGYLARMWEAGSTLGRVLDPIADKLLVAVALLMLVAEDQFLLLPAAAILCREILVSGLREFLIELRASMPVTKLAKWKTATQMLSIYLLLLGLRAEDPLLQNAYLAGIVFLWVAAAMTLYTGYIYLQTGMKHIDK